MSVFRRRRDEPGAAAGHGDAPALALPVSREVPAADPAGELALPPFRPAAKEPSSMNLPPKPNTAVGLPPRPMAAPLAPRTAAADRRTLVVGKGISLQGTVSDAERLVVEGTVESQMISATELVISHAGVFKGEVQVEDAEIAGLFDGTITASGNLVIRATGRVLGTARCRRLQVEDGGQLSGRMEMLTDAPAAAAPPLAAPLRPPIPAPLDA
jgi:cytoskeletal protein CcmA (bactofilin family)